MIIGTNILNKLSLVHKEQIHSSVGFIVKNQDNFKLIEYKEAQADDSGVIKFFIGDFPVYKITQDVKMWDYFVELFINMFVYSQEDVGKIHEVQFFLEFKHISTSVNVFCSVKEKDDVKKQIVSLRQELITQVFTNENLPHNKTIVFGFDTENNSWKINYL